MTDTTTRNRLKVSDGGTGGPYLMVPVDQLATVRAVLDRNSVFYWTEPNAISVGGGPSIAFINFGRSGVAERVQAILDAAE